MKESKKYVLMEAETNSEWDFCSLAIVEVDELKRIMELLVMPKNSKLDFIGINTASIEYLSNQDEIEFDLPCIVDWDDDKIESIGRPEQTIRYGQVTYHKRSKSFRFQAFGRHTGERFSGSIGSGEINELQITTIKSMQNA